MWHKDSITPGELDALCKTAERAWGRDTCYPLRSGDPDPSGGQCLVTAAWLVQRLGGNVGVRRGHYAWLSPDGAYSIDLTNGHQSGYCYGANDGYERIAGPDNARSQRFAKRADRIFENLESLLKFSGDLMGDAFPAEEPQRQEDLAQQYWHDEPGYEPQQEEYKFVYGNGSLEVSPVHEHAELAEHVGLPLDHKGPVGVGWVVVSNQKATWEVQSNINIKALERVFKDYGKQLGWKWGGITNIEGEPISDEFAPTKTSLLRFAYANDHLLLGRVSHSELLLQASGEGDSVYQSGWLRVGDRRADVYPVYAAVLPALEEWADDNGLTLYAGSLESPWGDIHGEDRKPSHYLNELVLNGAPRALNCPVCGEWGKDINDPNFPGYMNPAARDENYVEPPPCPTCQGETSKWPQPNNPTTSGNDNVLKTIEDLQQGNLGDNSGELDTADPHEGIERHPAGLYQCPGCDRLFARFQQFERHRRKGCDDHLPEQGGSFPKPDMDKPAPFQPDFTEQGPEVQVISRRQASRVDGFRGGMDIDEYYVAYHYGSPVGYARLRFGKIADLVCAKEGIRPHLMAKIVKYTEKEPKDLLEAGVPFVYDIDNDDITVGQPGQRTSDIPGRFTPGGIVEGLYEPGGKVFIRTMTNMPYTVRHLIELWYYQHPELTVKTVSLRDDAGGDTKLAAGQQEVGDTIARLVQADPAVRAAALALREAGGGVYAVGGAVRDAIIGNEPKDIDLMVTGIKPGQVGAILRALPGRVDLTGRDFGVFRYKHNGGEVEVALPRREKSTGATHQEFDVQADHTMTPEEDLYRRDFTANAMAVDLSNGRLIDPYGGTDDVGAGRLRTINRESLSEDPLRVLRGLVAHGRHDLYPDDATKAQMQAAAPSLQHLPGERIQDELTKLMRSKNPAAGIRLAHETGTLEHFLPEVAKCMGFDQRNPHHELMLGDHLVNVLDRTAQQSEDPDLRLAGLLHDIGKPDSAWWDTEKGHNHYYEKRLPDGSSIGRNHEDVGAEQARELMTRLRYPAKRIDRVAGLITHHMWKPFSSTRGARKFLNRVEPHADDLLKLRWADQGGKSEHPMDPTASIDVQRNLIERVRNGQEPTQRSQLAINGRDLLQAGIPAGPEIGQVLNKLMQAVIEDPRQNQRDTLLNLAQQEYATLGGSNAQAQEEAQDPNHQAHRYARPEAPEGDGEAEVEEPYFPSLEDAAEANKASLGIHGQDDDYALVRPEVLDGALNRAQNYWYYKDSLVEAAAALAHGVGQAQAFKDGNKRTAYWLTHHFLHENNLAHLTHDDDEELADHITGYGEGTHSMDDTIRMFENRAHGAHSS